MIAQSRKILRVPPKAPRDEGSGARDAAGAALLRAGRSALAGQKLTTGGRNWLIHGRSAAFSPEKISRDSAALAIKPGVAQQQAAPAERADPEIADSRRQPPEMIEIALPARGARDP